MRRLALLLLALGCAPAKPAVDAEALRPIAEEVDEARLTSLVQRLSDAHLADTPHDCSGWSVTYDPDCHHTSEKARALVESELKALGYEVRRHEANGPVLDGVNLVAELKGATSPDEVVMVGAHYDAFYGGADDNSTGTAGLVELARVLRGHTFDRTIRFVAFDLEELGLVGSTRYVRDELTGVRVVRLAVLESIGFFDAREGSQKSLPGFPSPSAANFIGVMADAASGLHGAEVMEVNAQLGLVGAVGITAPGESTYPLTGGLLRSDHTPFWLAGHPGLLVTDTANFRNPNYHTATDLPPTVDGPFLAGVTRLMAATVAHWAGGPR